MIDQQREEQIHIVIPGPGGETQVLSLPFVPGQRLRHYFRAPGIRRVLIGMRTRMRVTDQNLRVLRLSTKVEPGTTVYFRGSR